MPILDLTQEWKTIPVATGTVGNRSAETIEMARAEQDTGLFIYPKSKYSFKNAVMKARVVTGTKASVALVDYATEGTSGAGEEEETATTADIDALF